MSSDKAALRSTQRGRTLSSLERAHQSERLQARLCSLDVIVQANAVALFVGVGHEPETRGLFEALAPKERWLPKVVGPRELAWCAVTDWAGLQLGRFGIREPQGLGAPTLPAQVEVVLVPGLAFDARGGRLGWGRGYYDRALAQAPGARRVGVCLQGGLVDFVPMEPHDLRMHTVVSPSAAYP
ncbi:MAG: 5-formyltetrahydrofolate cyclo-ligase [Nannocystaceae bacterium]|nr:5-formyltetrahydrofolate cyclo-ligase [Nannocystaceae bacterium]